MAAALFIDGPSRIPSDGVISNTSGLSSGGSFLSNPSTSMSVFRYAPPPSGTCETLQLAVTAVGLESSKVPWQDEVV